MLEGPVFATQNVLKKLQLDIKQIDLYEVNEAFAPVPLAWAKAIGADIEKLNVNGGAMALGQPLGCTGTKLVATLVTELERRGGRYGLLSICEGWHGQCNSYRARNRSHTHIEALMERNY